MKILHICLDENEIVINDKFHRINLDDISDKFQNSDKTFASNAIYDFLKDGKFQKLIIQNLESSKEDFIKAFMINSYLLEIETFIISKHNFILGIFEYSQIHVNKIVSNDVVHTYKMLEILDTNISSNTYITISDLNNFINKKPYKIYLNNSGEEIESIQTQFSSSIVIDKDSEEVIFDSNEIQWNQSLKLGKPDFKQLFNSDKILNFYDLNI